MYYCKAPLSRFYYPDTRRIINAFIIIISSNNHTVGLSCHCPLHWSAMTACSMCQQCHMLENHKISLSCIVDHFLERLARCFISTFPTPCNASHVITTVMSYADY